MVHDRPTASVTGTDEWRWNEWQRARSEEASTPRERAGGGIDSRHCRPELRDHIRELETDLERRNRRFQAVLKQYERLLSERNKQLVEARKETDTERSVTAALRAIIEDGLHL